MRKFLFFLLFLSPITYYLSPDALADTVHKKDGQELKGIVVEDYRDRITFSTADGEISVMKSDIRELYFDTEEDNMIKLAEQAKDRGDYKRAYSYYDKAMKLNPNSKSAKDGMVYVQGYVYRQDEAKKEEAVKRQEELERYGPMVNAEKSYEDALKEGIDKLKSSLGIALKLKGNLPEAEAVSKKSPADDAGMVKGDLVVAIWGKLTGYMSLKEVIGLLLEKPSIEIKCTIERTVDVAPRRGDIGASFRMEFDGLTVWGVREEGPSAKAGILKKGDLIVAIDGQSTRYMPLKKALAMIRKAKDNTVKMTLRRELTLWRTGGA